MSGNRPVVALLTERIGLDPNSVGPSLIARGLDARKSALGLRDDQEYAQVLHSSGDEFQALIEEVVVPESWFFRDDHPFRFLQDFVRARWLLDPTRPPLRVLSLPCAGGEEPYSIAMSLLELGLLPDRFRVDAVDLSARSLARARQASYGKNSFRGADLSFRDRYFREHEGRYLLDAQVKNTVRLIQGNLLDTRLLAGEPAYDIVFCRNLLIYFTADARRLASATLIRLLARTGVLFLGHAERLDLDGTPLVAAGERGTFAYQRSPIRPADSPPSLPAPARIKALESPRRAAPAPAPPYRARPEVKQAEPAARIPPPPPTLAATEPGPPADLALLDRAAELADQGLYPEAVRLCEQALRESRPSAQAYFLLGMARQATGDRNAAEDALRKAVYLDAQHDEALLALALLAQRRGDTVSATAYRRRAERAVARKGSQ